MTKISDAIPSGITISNALQLANDRPTSLNDDLYQWAVDAEETIRKQDAMIKYALFEMRYLTGITKGQSLRVISRAIDNIQGKLNEQ